MFHDFQNQSSGLNDTGRDTGFAFNSSFLVCSLGHCLVFFSFLLPLTHLPFLCLMCRPVCSAVCAPLVLCHCWRMQPPKVASSFLPLLESTPGACDCLPRAVDSFIMWLGCSFSTSPLLMGIWAISSPLLLLVLWWIIMYIYHPVFLPVWYPWGLIFMRETDGLKSKCICNFGRYYQIPPTPLSLGWAVCVPNSNKWHDLFLLSLGNIVYHRVLESLLFQRVWKWDLVFQFSLLLWF